MASFVTILLFSSIGGFFWGITGFFIGLIIAFFVLAASASDDKNKANPVPPNTAITSALPTSQQTPGASKQTGPSVEQVHEYASCMTNLYATILSFYPSNDISKVNDVTELLKGDNWIPDKRAALDELARQFLQFQSERRDSPTLFQLHSNSHIARISQLPKPMRDRLAMQLDGFLNGLGDADPKDCKDLVEKVGEALGQGSPASKERLAAEDFIMRSGNSKAIGTLQKMRRNPRHYKELLRSGARENTVLRTAFGVFAGMVAADAVRAAVTNLQAHDLVTQLDHDITTAGGMDNVPLHDKELDSSESADPSNAALSSFSDDTDAYGWENETPDLSPEEDFSHAIQANAADFNWDADTEAERDEVSAEDTEAEPDEVSAEDTEAEYDEYVADSSNDLAFDSDD